MVRWPLLCVALSALTSSAAAQDATWELQLTSEPVAARGAVPAPACGTKIQAFAMKEASAASPALGKAYATLSAPGYGCFTEFQHRVEAPRTLNGTTTIQFSAACDLPSYMAGGQPTPGIPLGGPNFHVSLYRDSVRLAMLPVPGPAGACTPGDVISRSVNLTLDDVKLEAGQTLLLSINHYWANPDPELVRNFHFRVGGTDPSRVRVWLASPNATAITEPTSGEARPIEDGSAGVEAPRGKTPLVGLPTIATILGLAAACLRGRWP